MFKQKIPQPHKLYLGIDETERRAYLQDISRSMHTQIVGSTGVGKTESAMLPMIADDIAHGHAVLMIDPKGDKDTFEILLELCLLNGRIADLVELDLCKPGTSCRYNPLQIGTASELKDKIVGSIVWSEEFYKKVAERALLETFQYQLKKKQISTIDVTYKIISALPFDQLAPKVAIVPKTEGEVRTNPPTKTAAEVEYDDLTARFAKSRDQLEGIRTDLALWSTGDFAKIISDPNGASVLDWFLQKKIVYINLNTLAFEETSRRFGRLIVQDIKAAVQRLQGQPSHLRHPIRVYIDEFSSVASSGFIELLNKARSANVAITLAHQSLGDIQNVSDAFVNQILDNTNVKIIFRQDSPDSCEFFSRLIGTRKSDKATTQTQAGFFGGISSTGAGTLRPGDEFIVSPNAFRKFSRGEAIVLTKIPYSVHRVKFKPVSERLKELRASEQRRRLSWPSITRGA